MHIVVRNMEDLFWSALHHISTISASFLTLSLITFLTYVFYLNPQICRLKLRKQGVNGPSPSFLIGNIVDMKRMMPSSSIIPTIDIDFFPTVFPYFKHWTNNYGRTFMFSLGGIQLLYTADPKMVKEVRVLRSLDLGKPAYLQKERGALLGKGLITANGAVWSHQRKTLAPYLYMDKIKNTLDLMVESGNTLIKSWEKIVDSQSAIADITVDDYVRSYNSYIISKMVFGDDYDKGIETVPKCLALIRAMGSTTTLGLPLLRFLPTKGHMNAWRLQREVHSIIMDIVKARTGGSSKDILQAVIDASKNGELGSLTPDEFIVDNVKDIFLAATEVSAITAIWGLMLLAKYTEWQDRVRSEIQKVCGGRPLDFDMLSHMKVLKMVILEILRLYPGVVTVSRQALKDVKLGNLNVPKDVNIWVTLPVLHRDPEFWGPDADKFDPERFADGVSRACKSSHAYIPFGIGPRVCPGQIFAMTELKVLFVMILSRFKLTPSPNYRHSPKFGLLLGPENGVNILIKKI